MEQLALKEPVYEAAERRIAVTAQLAAAAERDAVLSEERLVASMPPLMHELQVARQLKTCPDSGLFQEYLSADIAIFDSLQSCGATELYRLREAAHGGTLPKEQQLRSAATADLAVVKAACQALWERSRLAAVLEWKTLRKDAIAADGEALKSLCGELRDDSQEVQHRVASLAHLRADLVAYNGRATAQDKAAAAAHQREVSRRATVAALRAELEERRAANEARAAEVLQGASERSRLQNKHSQLQEKRQLAQGKVDALLRCGANNSSEESKQRRNQEAEDAEEQCDMLKISTGLVGWELVAVRPLDTSAPDAGMELDLQFGPLVQARLTLQRGDCGRCVTSVNVGQSPLEAQQQLSGGGRHHHSSVLRAADAATTAEAEGIISAAMGDLLGTVPLQKSSRCAAAVAVRLSDIAMRAAVGRRLAAQAEVLRCAMPCLTRVEWRAPGGEEDSAMVSQGGALRLGLLSWEQRALFHADIMIGPDFDTAEKAECCPVVELAGAANVTVAAVDAAVASVPCRADRLIRIGKALSKLARFGTDDGVPGYEVHNTSTQTEVVNESTNV